MRMRHGNGSEQEEKSEEQMLLHHFHLFVLLRGWGNFDCPTSARER